MAQRRSYISVDIVVAMWLPRALPEAAFPLSDFEELGLVIRGLDAAEVLISQLAACACRLGLLSPLLFPAESFLSLVLLYSAASVNRHQNTSLSLPQSSKCQTPKHRSQDGRNDPDWKDKLFSI